jgi:hypothetical protein
MRKGLQLKGAYGDEALRLVKQVLLRLTVWLLPAEALHFEATRALDKTPIFMTP